MASGSFRIRQKPPSTTSLRLDVSETECSSNSISGGQHTIAGEELGYGRARFHRGHDRLLRHSSLQLLFIPKSLAKLGRAVAQVGRMKEGGRGKCERDLHHSHRRGWVVHADGIKWIELLGASVVLHLAREQRLGGNHHLGGRRASDRPEAGTEKR